MTFSSVRRIAAAAAVGVAAAGCGRHADDGRLTLGFSQEGAESGWRAANTLSIHDAAAPAGVDLHFTDSQGVQQRQLDALDAFLQQRLDVVAVSPMEAHGWEPILRKFKAAGVPVICSDRTVEVSDPSLQPIFVGSDLKLEGRRAGEWLAKRTNGTCRIVQLEGNRGASATVDRTDGFAAAVAAHPGMTIAVSRNADWSRAGGKAAMEAILKSPEGAGVTAVYAENDDMAVGAIQALDAAGRKPGRDVVLISVDAGRDALQAVIDGTLNCTIECNPLLGPAIMETAKKLHAGQPVPARVISDEPLFDDPARARAVIGTRKY